MEILALFGIDWKLMLAQLVNFAIVVVVLWWFALKPLMKMMKKRGKEIEQGLDDAKEATAKLERAEKQVEEKIKESNFDAAVSLVEAKKQAEAVRQVGLTKTKDEISKMISKAKEQMEQEKQGMVKKAQGEVGKIIVQALDKILSAGLTRQIDQKYIEQKLKELKQ